MYLKRSTSKRNNKVSETFQIVEAYRDGNGNPRQRTLLHLGTADKFLKKDIDSLINGLLKIKGLNLADLDTEFDSAKSFGQIWAIMHLWNELKITQAIAQENKKTNITIDLDSHLKALVFNRIDDPSSKLKLLTWLENIHIPGINEADIHYEYLLRTMDFLISHKNEIENKIANRFLTLFDTSVKLCFYDITSTYFEADNSLKEDDIRKKGHTRDHRPDREQIVVGIVMTQDGIPIAHYTFSGNTADRSTIKKVVQDIKERFQVKNVTIVADKGMVSGKNLKLLLDNGDDFIFGESVRQTVIAKEIIKESYESRRETDIKSSEFIYETNKEKLINYEEEINGEIKNRKVTRNLRFVACYNSSVGNKKYSTRMKNIASVIEEIEHIKHKEILLEDKYFQVSSYLKRKHLTRFLTAKIINNDILLTREEEVIVQEERSDGWFLVITTNRNMSKEDIIKKYKDLKYVEHGFFELKHSLRLRPNHHWTEKRILGHVMVCFIAFQVSCLFEKKLSSLKLSWEKAVEKLRRIKVIEWEVKDRKRRGLVKSSEEQLQIFKLVGCKKPTLNYL